MPGGGVLSYCILQPLRALEEWWFPLLGTVKLISQLLDCKFTECIRPTWGREYVRMNLVLDILAGLGNPGVRAGIVGSKQP